VNDQPDQPDAISAWPQHHSLTVEVLRRPIEPTLHPAVGVVDQLVQAGVLAGPDPHLQRVQRQLGAQVPATRQPTMARL
jgi:hypothetical protein